MARNIRRGSESAGKTTIKFGGDCGDGAWILIGCTIIGAVIVILIAMGIYHIWASDILGL